MTKLKFAIRIITCRLISPYKNIGSVHEHFSSIAANLTTSLPSQDTISKLFWRSVTLRQKFGPMKAE